MNWFTENPFPAIMSGALLVVASFVFALILKDRRLVYFGVFCVLATIGAVVVERMIVTDREQVQINIELMAHCVRKNDLDGLLEFVSKNEKNGEIVSARRRFERTMPQVVFKGCRIVNLKVEVDDGGDSATATFAALVNVDTDLHGGHVGWANPKCLLKFGKESDGQWRVVFFSYETRLR